LVADRTLLRWVTNLGSQTDWNSGSENSTGSLREKYSEIPREIPRGWN
jgi:hypothetical protein